MCIVSQCLFTLETTDGMFHMLPISSSWFRTLSQKAFYTSTCRAKPPPGFQLDLSSPPSHSLFQCLHYYLCFCPPALTGARGGCCVLLDAVLVFCGPLPQGLMHTPTPHPSNTAVTGQVTLPIKRARVHVLGPVIQSPSTVSVCAIHQHVA